MSNPKQSSALDRAIDFYGSTGPNAALVAGAFAELRFQNETLRREVQRLADIVQRLEKR